MKPTDDNSVSTRPPHTPSGINLLPATLASASAGVALGVTPIGARFARIRSTKAFLASLSSFVTSFSISL